MSGFKGMDVEQVRRLADQLDAKANVINDIAAQLSNQLGSTDWRGPDSERFRSDWDSHHRSALNRVMQALQDAARTSRRNANEQEHASGQ